MGDDASEYIVKNIVHHLCITDEFANSETGVFTTEPSGGSSTDLVAEKIRSAMRQAFLNSDAALLAMCSEKGLHYASSTGVSAFLWRNLLTVAHVGDSKACIARMINTDIHPEWLTVDHKPNMPNELKRIEASGGSLAWLHGNKPYIRYIIHRLQAHSETSVTASRNLLIFRFSHVLGVVIFSADKQLGSIPSN